MNYILSTNFSEKKNNDGEFEALVMVKNVFYVLIIVN